MKRHAFALLLVSASTLAEASNYPPGYEVDRACQSRGPVEVCAVNRRYGGFPRLEIRYKGQLSAAHWGRVSAFVRLNGRSGTFAMKNENYIEVLRLNQPNARMCFVVDSNLEVLPEPPHGAFEWCRFTRRPGGGGLEWETDPVAKTESDLFFFARNEFGVANAWDVEVAFMAPSGEWDSLSGANYGFRFE